MNEQTIEQRVQAAREGDMLALERLIESVQDRIYGIALRMLGHPQDAQDATQEILLKMVTHLSTFRGESSFSTWACRIAVNYLLTTRKRQREREALSFDELTEQINAGLHIASKHNNEAADQPLLLEEMKLHCTQGMLLCLNREQRIAYILSEVFEVSSQEGADILEISPELFRQRLTRARKNLRTFMQDTCGLVNPANPCSCRRQVQAALTVGKMHTDHLPFAQHPVATIPYHEVHEMSQELENLDRVAAIFRGHPHYAAPDSFVLVMKGLLQSRQFRLFSENEAKQ